MRLEFFVYLLEAELTKPNGEITKCSLEPIYWSKKGNFVNYAQWKLKEYDLEFSIFDIEDTNVANIIIQIKILNSTRQASYISNLHVWYHDGFWHQQASPATWWRIWASILIFWATHFQRWLRLRTIFLTKGQPPSQPSHHLSTPTSNLSA